jgi:hypothetical protein
MGFKRGRAGKAYPQRAPAKDRAARSKPPLAHFVTPPKALTSTIITTVSGVRHASHRKK